MWIRAAALTAIAPMLLVARVASPQPAVSIARDLDGRLAVEVTSLEQLQAKPRAGVAIWGEDGQDRWSKLSEAGKHTKSRLPNADAVTLAQSRGGPPGFQQSAATETRELDQLLGAEIVRAVSAGQLYTPPNHGIVANPQITIRRLAQDTLPQYPADEWVLFRGKSEVAHIPIAEGAQDVRWSDLRDLPESLQAGLPAGRYLLESKTSKTRTTFTVLPAEVWQRQLSKTAAIRTLTGDQDPLATQLLVEELLAYAGNLDSGALAADALDVLRSAHRTKYLDQLFVRIDRQLRGEPQTEQPASDATGIASVDEARELIARGQWTRALEKLRGIRADSSRRDLGLAKVYEAVVLAESGAATGGDAEFAFETAIADLKAATPADMFRAHFNFANFALRRAQDRLYNQSFQAATGGQQPLLTLLADWILARQHLEVAEELAKNVGPAAVGAVKVNAARAYVLLADILAVVNSTMPESDRFLDGENAAIDQATAALSDLLKPGSAADSPLITAVAHEIASHLSYRRADYQLCRTDATLARQTYLDEGYLVGIEGIDRLLGLTYLREDGSDAANTSRFREQAIQHLLLSHELSEVLRDRFPKDIVGLTRAGFFARRAYVNEKLIELHLLNSQPERALEIAEAAKSRTLNDVLAVQPGSAKTAHTVSSTARQSINWPSDSIALEYFIGSQKAWVFVVQGAKVQAFELVDVQGLPIEPRRIVAEVQTFLQETEGTAEKMLRRIQSGRALDSTWQHQLHRFYHVLIPAPIRTEVDQAKFVLIVPHHILHYFPFAALVIEPDHTPRKVAEMPMPQFLIDRGQTIAFAPSLSTWVALRSQKHEAETANAIAISEFNTAVPLPGVKDDLKNFQAAFKGKVSCVLQDSAATEEELSEVLKRPGLTFIGTHGVNIADQPLASYILCEPGRGDGRFTAAEIYNSACAADVVVLSACYSGLGDRSPLPGDDLFGIQRAFLQSGVGTVVAGLWDVYEGTGVEIMRDFFRAVRQGETMPEALANSQRKFLSARRAEGPQDFWIHPYFWAVYKSTGSDLTRFTATPKAKDKQ